MSEEPISQIVFHVKKECLNDIETLAGLDRGCSLTKLVYVPKSQPTNEAGDYLLTCALYPNSKFEAALQWLKKEALLPEKGHFHVTGAGGVNFKDLISETLGLEVVFVDEFLSQCRGAHFVIKNLDEQEITYPHIEVPELQMEYTHTMQQLRQKMKETLGMEDENKDKFPCAFAFLGSGAGIVQLNESGTYKMIGGIVLGGKTFLGLGRCLLETNDYDEILDLAAKGNRNNVDTQVWEVLHEDKTSHYGRFPPELPIFAFGKAADNDIGMEKLEKVDVARSLVALFGFNVMQSLIQTCMQLQLKNVYLGGHLLRGETFRIDIDTSMKMWGMNLRYHFLKTGNTAAIGAMISNPGDEKKYLVM